MNFVFSFRLLSFFSSLVLRALLDVFVFIIFVVVGRFLVLLV